MRCAVSPPLASHAVRFAGDPKKDTADPKPVSEFFPPPVPDILQQLNNQPGRFSRLVGKLFPKRHEDEQLTALLTAIEQKIISGKAQISSDDGARNGFDSIRLKTDQHEYRIHMSIEDRYKDDYDKKTSALYCRDAFSLATIDGPLENQISLRFDREWPFPSLRSELVLTIYRDGEFQYVKSKKRSVIKKARQVGKLLTLLAKNYRAQAKQAEPTLYSQF